MRVIDAPTEDRRAWLAEPRKAPAYTARDAARYLRMSESTLRHWMRQSPPLICPVRSAQPIMLSFENLVEVYVLESLRKRHRVPMHRVREGLALAAQEHATTRPLWDVQFLTSGTSLWFDSPKGALLNAADPRQPRLFDDEEIRVMLARVERDEHRIALRLNPPILGWNDTLADRVTLDPSVAFGKLIVKHAGVPTKVIADRFYGGDLPSALASEYGCDEQDVLVAVRCEPNTALAA